MASVRKKLREAFFFYRNLSEHSTTFEPEDERLDFFLSAFLSAGRSITMFFDEKENQTWFQDWRKALPGEDKQLLTDMIRQRNLEVHERGSDLIPEFRPTASSVGEIQGSGSTQSLSICKKYYFWIDGRQTDIESTCKRYLDLLLRLIVDFEAHLLVVGRDLFIALDAH